MATPKLCAAPDCSKPAHGRYCFMHRARLQRGGSLEPRRPTKTLAELLGDRFQFGHWHVLGEGEFYQRPLKQGRRDPNGRQRTVHCKCVCGVERDIAIQSLKDSRSRHCGCLVSAMTTEQKTTHGKSRTAEYRAWRKMKERCLNPNCMDWLDYGGRGITIHPPWIVDFMAFYDHMGPKPSPRHSIDRQDVNGHYVPSNVRWATPSEQAQNKRGTVYVQLEGHKVPLATACRMLGMPYKLVHQRMTKYGQSFAKASGTV